MSRKRQSVLCFVGFLILLTGCVTEAKKQARGTNKKYKTDLIRYNELFTDGNNNLSFPLWFNDTLIQQRHIRKIVRNIYPKINKDSTGQDESSYYLPRESREYFFLKTGKIEKLLIRTYYDDQEVGVKTYAYNSGIDDFGFSQVEEQNQSKYENNPIEREDIYTKENTREMNFITYDKVEYSDRYLVYRDRETGDYLFYMLDHKSWGPVSVDSILKPTPLDLIVLGTPMLPVKKYYVLNKVHESKVKLYTYHKRYRQFIERFVQQDYPFENKRTFNYSISGICSGFTDSTFSDGLFLTRMSSKFIRKESGEVAKIMHRKENMTSQFGSFYMETFEYLYFE
jgi:hypothetical protein